MTVVCVSTFRDRKHDRGESLFYDYTNVLGLSYISRVPGSFAGTFEDL